MCNPGRSAVFALTVIAAVAGIARAGLAFGNDDHWVSGWGMGTKEAVITKGPDNNIYVACDEGSGLGSSIRFMLGGDGPKGDSVILTFDGMEPTDIWISDGRITSDCRAYAANFDFVLDLLKSRSRVHVRFENGPAASFPLKGSRAAIGTCEADFYK